MTDYTVVAMVTNVNGTTSVTATATVADAWINTAVAAQSGSFEWKFDAVPTLSPADIVIGLSNSAVSAYTSLAAIIRFSPVGVIDVRDGAAYSSLVNVPYVANGLYHFRVDVSIPTHTYSVFVTPDTKAEITLATNVAFRTEQGAIAVLNNLAVFGSPGMALIYRQSFLGQTNPLGLLDTFPGATILLSTTKESSVYGGSSFRVRRVSDSVQQDIGWNGKNADAAALTAFIGGSTGRVARWYDQSGHGNDAVQATTTRQWLTVVDADGKVSFQADTTGQWMTIADNASFKTAKVHLFSVVYPGYVQDTTGNAYSIINYGASTIGAGRFGLGLGPFDTFASYMPLNGVLNGAQNYVQGSFGNAHVGNFHVWDLLTNTATLRHDTAPLTSGQPTADVTYPVSQSIFLGNDGSNDSPYLGKSRMFVAYGAARTDRDSISNYLIGTFGITPLPTTTSTSDGMVWTPKYFPSFNNDPTDIYSMIWSQQDGGYPWSLWYGNVHNATTLARFQVDPGDSDVIVTGAERSENSGTWNGNSIVAGTDFDLFAQFLVEPGATQTGDWCLTFQIHYGSGEVSGTPDLVFLNLKNDVFQVVTGGDGTQSDQGSSVAYSRGVWYAIRIQAHISANHTTDTIQAWLGLNGGALTQIVNVGSSPIFNSNSWDAYNKRGIYRGPNNAGNIAMRVANYQFSQTLNTFSSFVTSQPALPT